jgi:hypothetical protein
MKPHEHVKENQRLRGRGFQEARKLCNDAELTNMFQCGTVPIRKCPFHSGTALLVIVTQVTTSTRASRSPEWVDLLENSTPDRFSNGA